jgi:excisionase family DNA binding protein
MSDFVTLQDAAERLGVHYMTAYRYVRLGQLAAQKVGGTWRVATSDLDLFQQPNASEPSPSLSRKSAPWNERLENRLLDGDHSGAWKVVEASLTAGMSPLDVYCDVFVPALDSIGRRWENDEIGVADEHLASVIVSRMIGRLGPHFSRRGRRRGTVFVAGPPGERHSLGLAMAADSLRAGGYSAVDLGGDVPVDSFAESLERAEALKGVCIGLLNPAALEGCRQMVAAARRHLDRDAPVVLGGRAVDGQDHAHRLGADRWADLRHVVEAVDSGRAMQPAVWV